nr:MAG TPA: hypothetical protein [Inoviridae sp.]
MAAVRLTRPHNTFRSPSAGKAHNTAVWRRFFVHQNLRIFRGYKEAFPGHRI